MCNLYSLTKGQAAIRDWFRARQDRTGNLPLFPGIFPDQMAPVVRASTDGERELVMARWGMPGPPQYGGAPVTNIRNLESPHWRGWLGVRNRCLVPATSFCEYADTQPRKTPIWFALDEDRPLFAFAGLWDRLARRARSQERAGRRRASAVRLLDDGSERDHRAHSPQGDASDPHDTGRVRPLAGGGHPRGAGVATAAAGRCAQGRGEGREARRRTGSSPCWRSKRAGGRLKECL